MKTQKAQFNPYRGRRVLELVARGLAIFMLGIWLTQVIPGATHRAYAAPLEDCDLDGFDDATGVPVPWPGYDETHGDTSAGPGTADWWVKQNQGSSSGSSSGSGGGSTGSGSSSSGSGSSSSGSGSGKNSGSSSTSGGSKSTSSGGSSRSTASTGNDTTKANADAATNTGAKTAAQASSLPTTVASSAATESLSAAPSAAAESSSATIGLNASNKGSNLAGGGSLLSALTVGFTGDNQELGAGLSILGALALLGLVSTGMSSIGLRRRVE